LLYSEEDLSNHKFNYLALFYKFPKGIILFPKIPLCPMRYKCYDEDGNNRIFKKQGVEK